MPISWTERIERAILLIRGQKVIQDELSDFIFQLKLQEVRALRSQFATSSLQPIDSDKDSPPPAASDFGPKGTGSISEW